MRACAHEGCTGLKLCATATGMALHAVYAHGYVRNEYVNVMCAAHDVHNQTGCVRVLGLGGLVFKTTCL